MKKESNIIRSSDGIPIVPISAKRPSVYKPIYKDDERPNSKSSGGSKSKRILPQGKARKKEIINPNRLRIVGGTAKGKKIESPDVYLRPMMAKVREALFSTLLFMQVFEGHNTRVLDIFSGSGSIGLEALSRGACHTTFVDFSDNCVETALKNAENCGFGHQVDACCAPAEEVLRNPEKFGVEGTYGLITLTPPYEEVVYQDLLEAVSNTPLIAEDSLVVIEYPEEMGALPHIIGEDKLFGVRNRKYGRTIVALYVYRPNKKIDMRPDEFAP
eukprot:CAMPEP_0174954954 /NCGR_PEP_ID=MMETSP0004_2-20121128/717_1 /TAXON_ID=420556 /ORGANISM="Ochromonas sp., Strain CCMP1393" /LENGTH=271 /DNA_ID=CAMNT_0016202837 /DNA_START=96 /DNA_END=911 /DNA_ORIENTATION=+